MPGSPVTPQHARAPTHLRRGIGRVADPKITLASVASMLVGGAAAAHDGVIAWGWLALTGLGIFMLEAAKNASGEIFDFDSGADTAIADADRSPFSGGKRVLVDGILSRRQVAALAGVFYGLAAAAGVAIAAVHEPRVLWIGLLGMALAFFYHAPPLKLAYRGLGEIAVALTYGPLIASGTYLVQRHASWSDSLLPALPLGVLIGAFLLINEFPDHDADRAAGKRTLVVRLGKRRAARLFTCVLATAFVCVAALPLLGLPAWTLLGLLPLPLAWRAAQRLSRHAHDTAAIVPAQAWTLQTFVLFAVCVSVGLLLPR